mmetsp:Transcript_30684/g.91085  ORF Transcript_30684/g.91085 Transcript_30684/m.91085 type:complete len:219 (+) Transcript_30684:390-1046(+)
MGILVSKLMAGGVVGLCCSLAAACDAPGSGPSKPLPGSWMVFDTRLTAWPGLRSFRPSACSSIGAAACAPGLPATTFGRLAISWSMGTGEVHLSNWCCKSMGRTMAPFGASWKDWAFVNFGGADDATAGTETAAGMLTDPPGATANFFRGPATIDPPSTSRAWMRTDPPCRTTPAGLPMSRELALITSLSMPERPATKGSVTAVIGKSSLWRLEPKWP